MVDVRLNPTSVTTEQGRAVVVAEARTPFELEAIRGWAAVNHPGAPVTQLGEACLGDMDPDTVLAPARVVWLPPSRKSGDRRVILADVMALTNPWRPPGLMQSRIARRSPDRMQVVSGKPATVADLRARYDAGVASGEPFEDFVRVQATLSAERAERRVVGDRYKVPRLVAEQIGSSARFRREAAALARRLGRPEAAVTREATDKLSSFVATQSRVMMDLFAGIFAVMHERAWTVSVDLDTLDRLRRLNKDSGLIFLPAHRSYMDPLVLGQVLREHDFPPNHVLGGANLSFWPVGAIGRRSGLIFIRRAFGDDPVYKFAMRAYLAHLVEKRFNLEWYIEGGRSRTGKLRKPKLGLLAYVVDAVESLDDTDVTLVPTSIVYDQMAEVGAMAAESRGGVKKPEGLGWMLRYARAQRSHRGAARIRFGEPFSLREALVDAGDGPARLEKIAFRVMDGINVATPVSATGLATFALLGANNQAFTEREIERIVAPLLDYLDRRGLPGPDPALCRGLGLRRTLGELSAAGVLCRYDGGSEPVWWVARDNHGVAAYYRNGALHYLVDRAIVELALLTASRWELPENASSDDTLRAAREEALRIRDLLKFEFFFPAKDEHVDRFVVELDLLAPDWRTAEVSPQWSRRVLRVHAGALVARRALQPFVEAQLVVARRLVQLEDRWVNSEEFLTECLGLGRQLSLQGVVRAEDSVSRELYAAALELAANRGLVDDGGDGLDDLVARRGEFLAEIEDLHGRLRSIADLEADEPAEVGG